ncbi:SH3 domain-containing protein [Runella limosa]|uniref:SH3 domain-containing protein n=1 Tax=Runella limosa TaxID=370978 RepID=UPI000415D5A0|nr:SH3 domain-containing protein [Runella limosa]
MTALFRVIPNAVNVRSTPSKDNPSNIITTLNHNEVVALVDNTNVSWFKVTFTKNNQTLDGFIFSTLLEPVLQDNVLPQINNLVVPPAVHFSSHVRSNRNSLDFRHCPLSETTMPFRDAQDATTQAQQIHQIINFLSVTTSKRYLPTQTATYCNIYAYDVCFLSKVYLPRVWWESKALLSIQQGLPVSVVYGETVRELRANDLFDWLKEWGDDYGWTRTFDLTDLQNQANMGKVGIICAKRLDTNRSGHIVAVVPETQSFQALRTGGSVIEPLQSQAGVSNKKLFNNSGRWWINPQKFREFGFWYHS